MNKTEEIKNKFQDLLIQAGIDFAKCSRICYGENITIENVSEMLQIMDNVRGTLLGVVMLTLPSITMGAEEYRQESDYVLRYIRENCDLGRDNALEVSSNIAISLHTILKEAAK